MSSRRRRKKNSLSRALNNALAAVFEGIAGAWRRPAGKAVMALVLVLIVGGVVFAVCRGLAPEKEPEVLPEETPAQQEQVSQLPEEDVLDLPEVSDPPVDEPTVVPEEPVDDGLPKPDPVSKQGVDFAALREQLAAAKAVNDEAVAWLYIPNTTVSHPVFLTDNNNFYLDHNATKAYDPYGIPYIDFRNHVGLRASDFDTNTIIYAHNKADHLLFGQLLDTYLTADTARDSCYVYLVTEGEVLIFKVFAGFYTNGSVNGEKIFNYRQISPDAEAIVKLAADAKERSWVKYGVDVQDGDKLITLSTCAYRYRYASTGGYIDSTRFGVMARLLRDGETDGDPIAVYDNREPLEPTFPTSYYASPTAR